MIYATSQTNACCIQRFIAVAFPVIVVGFVALSHELPFFRSHWIAATAGILLTAWLTVSGLRLVDAAEKHRREGSGIATQKWRDSPLLTTFDRDSYSIVYSNRPELLYYYGEVDAPRLSPAIGYYHSNELRDTLPQFLSELENSDGRIGLVWFFEGSPNFLFDKEVVVRASRARILASFADGEVWEISKSQ